jgi:DMSO/TMAO reductase YedYZ heme-binding membrane subunit
MLFFAVLLVILTVIIYGLIQRALKLLVISNFRLRNSYAYVSVSTIAFLVLFRQTFTSNQNSPVKTII